MKSSVWFLLVLLLFLHSKTEEGRSVLENFIVPYRVFGLLRFNLLSSLKQRSRSYLNDKLQDPVPEFTPFPCDVQNTRSVNRPQSVHKLRPGDIDVIGALGDSLTVCFGGTATNILEVFYEERGKSFAIGGEGNWRQYTTLPNILKVFNPNLIGYSLKSSLSIQDESQLNVAEGGAMSSDLVYMTKELIKRVKLDRRINLTEDWKMFTIFIGSNDFCEDLCYHDRPESRLLKHKNTLLQVLRLVRDNLPRSFVNLMPPANLKKLVELKVNNPLCYFTRRFECPCLFGLPNEHKRSLMYDLMSDWQKIDIEVGNLDEFDRDDFTVVVQPIALNYTFPKIAPNIADEKYLSADCFHWSQRMNARVGNDLWNVIMEPVGRKSQDGTDFLTKFNCPSENNPYLFTRRNSRPF